MDQLIHFRRRRFASSQSAKLVRPSLLVVLFSIIQFLVLGVM
jgi:hypothetical protein